MPKNVLMFCKEEPEIPLIVSCLSFFFRRADHAAFSSAACMLGFLVFFSAPLRWFALYRGIIWPFEALFGICVFAYLHVAWSICFVHLHYVRPSYINIICFFFWKKGRTRNSIQFHSDFQKHPAIRIQGPKAEIIYLSILIEHCTMRRGESW